LAIITISLYANCVVTASVVLCAGYAIAANTNIYNKRKVWVKRFADAYYKSEESIAKDVTCLENKEVTSLIKVKLRQS
jgi:hypothetical protein